MAPAEAVASTAAGFEHQFSSASGRDDSSPEREEHKPCFVGGEDAVLEGGRHRTVQDLFERIMIGTPRPRERTKHPSLPQSACKASMRLLVQLFDGLSRDHEPRVCVTSKVLRLLTMEEKRAYIMGVGDTLCALSRGELRPITSMRVAENAVRKPEKVIRRLVDAVKSMTLILDEAKSTEKTEARHNTVPNLELPKDPEVHDQKQHKQAEQPEQRSARSPRREAPTPRSADSAMHSPAKDTTACADANDERSPTPCVAPAFELDTPAVTEVTRDGCDTEILESESGDNVKCQRKVQYDPEMLEELEEDQYEDEDSAKRKYTRRQDGSISHKKHKVTLLKKKEESRGLWKFGNDLASNLNLFSDMEEGKQKALLRRAARHTRDDVHYMSNDDLHELRVRHCGHMRDALRAKLKDKLPEPHKSVSLPALPGVTAAEQVRKLQFILKPDVDAKYKKYLPADHVLMDLKASFENLKKRSGTEDVPEAAFHFALFADKTFNGDLRTLFRMIDQNQNMRLSMMEFLQSLSLMKFIDASDPASSPDACRRLFFFFDSNRTGIITWKDFVKLADIQKAIADYKQEIAKSGQDVTKFDKDAMSFLKNRYREVTGLNSPVGSVADHANQNPRQGAICESLDSDGRIADLDVEHLSSCAAASNSKRGTRSTKKLIKKTK